MKQPTRINQTGYTLLEMLLYVSMVAVILLSLTYFFVTVVETRAKNQSISEVNDQAADVMDMMTQTIRNATSITAPAAGANAASLTLVVPTGALSPTVFNLSGTTLQITEGAAAAVALTNSKVQVTGLTFRNLTRTGTGGVVQVTFTMNRLNPNNRNEYEFQKTFTSSAEVAW